MLTDGQARNLLARLLDAVEEPGLATLRDLDELSAGGLLRLDSLARSYSPTGASLTGTSLAVRLKASQGLPALLAASLHGDGYLRQWAVTQLSSYPEPLIASFLALRLLDHVEQVRDAAAAALTSRPLDDAGRALAVLLAGAAKEHAPAALADLSPRIQSRFGDEALRELRINRDGGVRRWAYRGCLDRELLDAAGLRATVCREPDQLIRAWCAQALAKRAEPADVQFLLAGSLTAGRLAVLTLVPDDLLTTVLLRALLCDPAASVRRSAQWRARRRGLDPSEHYRQQLLTEQSPGQVAACLDGLADTGSAEDLPLLLCFLTAPSARVRAAAVTAVARLTSAQQLPPLLGPRMLDPAGRVATAAARALTRSPSQNTTSWTEQAWTSAQPASRRAAWLLERSRGGWDRVEADARAAADDDDTLHRLGRGGLLSWLAHGAATTYGQPTPDQSARIAAALARTGLASSQTQKLAFHAGLPRPESMVTSSAPAAEPAQRAGRTRRLLSRLFPDRAVRTENNDERRG